jgi:hypothetical protein
MMRVLKFLAGIRPDHAGFSFALPRTIQKVTELSLQAVCEIIEEAEEEGLVRTMRTNIPGPDRIISAMITEKGCSATCTYTLTKNACISLYCAYPFIVPKKEWRELNPLTLVHIVCGALPIGTCRTI